MASGPNPSTQAAFGLPFFHGPAARKRTDASEGRYPYRIGKGVIFGDPFVHSTEPGTCDPPVVLLSFTFGTDKMTYWDRIARTGAYQGNLVRRPDGSFLCRDFDC